MTKTLEQKCTDNIRSKGWKSDDDLIKEYIGLLESYGCFGTVEYYKKNHERRDEIRKELGDDKLEIGLLKLTVEGLEKQMCNVEKYLIANPPSWGKAAYEKIKDE